MSQPIFLFLSGAQVAEEEGEQETAAAGADVEAEPEEPGKFEKSWLS